MPVAVRETDGVSIGLAAISLLLGVTLLGTPQAHTAQGIQLSIHAASCRDSRLPPRSKKPWEEGPHLRLEVDVDGDGLVDGLEVTDSVGSGFSSTVVQITLGGSGTQLQAEEGFAFSAITAINPVPKELLDPRHRSALTWIEEALFGRICTTPDPSLAWLLDRRKRLTWIEGPREIPGGYAIRLAARRLVGLSLEEAYVQGTIDPDGQVWLFYAGHVHAGRRRGSRRLIHEVQCYGRRARPFFAQRFGQPLHRRCIEH